MKVKDRLLLQFTVLFSILLVSVLAGIYIITDQNRKSEFRARLKDRATVVAQLFLAEDNLSSDEFKEIIKKYPQSLPFELVRIYDKVDKPVFLKDKIPQEWTPAVIARVRKDGYLHFADHDRQVVGLLYHDNSGDFCVLISAKDIYGTKSMDQLLRLMLISFLSSLFIILVIGHFFSRVALQPIKKIIKELKIVRASSLHQRLQVKTGKDEISELIHSFNELLDHLEQSFESQKQFVANASHELRTPLTSILGTLEVTLRATRDEEDYRQTLKEVLNEAEHLNELLNSLLELAHSTVGDDDYQEVRLDELLWQVKDEYAAQDDVMLTYNLPGNLRFYTISCNRQLLFLAIGNILKNAVKFSNGKRVDCVFSASPSKTTLLIRDQGIGIHEADLKNIFRPFFRSVNARTYPGTGTGLSLSEKILNLHNIKLSIQSVVGVGTDVVIDFTDAIG